MPDFHCLLCDHDRGRPVMDREEPEPLALWACGSCRLVQLHPAPDVEECVESYEEAGHYAVETLTIEDGVLQRDRAILDELAAQGVEGPMLDIGAGAGTLVQAARERGWEVSAVELARPSAAALRERHGIEVFERPLEELGLPARFGLAVMSHSLEHVARPAETLAAAGRCLAPGGRVHVAVPHWQSLKRWLAGPHMPWIFPGHLSYFTRSTLEQTARRAGLRATWIRTQPFVGIDYRFAIGVLRRLRLEPRLARYLKLGEPRLDSLLADDLQLECSPQRFHRVLRLVHLLLRLLDDRLASRVGRGEELRMLAEPSPS